MANRFVFDSNLIYPQIHSINVDSITVAELAIPSSRYFYLSNTVPQSLIPYLASNDPTQNKRDIAAWLHNRNFRTIYALESVDSIEPEIDFISVSEGRRINLPDRDNRQYFLEFQEILFSYRRMRNNTERFALIPNQQMVKDMLNYPFNKAADFIRASQLANNPTAESIQAYLDEIGVVTFKGENIKQFKRNVIFFYLTRFYGPPIEGNITAAAIERKYLRLSLNNTTKKLAKKILQNIDKYNQYQKEFDLFFVSLNQNPDIPIENNFNTNSRTRLLNDFFSYLPLLRAPNNLPLLTLNTIRQLNTRNSQQVENFLANYADNVIIGLLGTNHQFVTYETRRLFLNAAANNLVGTRTFLLLPNEAELCINSESYSTYRFEELTYLYIGRGSLTTGFICYDILDLFEVFEANKDSEGIYIFRDPADFSRTFTVYDLEQFLTAVNSGRGAPPDPRIIKRFNYYIQQAKFQGSPDFIHINAFKTWINENPEVNKPIVRNVFMQYFILGMYMRQWKGPGTPYPILKYQTGSEARIASNVDFEISGNVYRERKKFEEEILPLLPEELREHFWSLRIYFFQNGSIVDKGDTIRGRWNNVFIIPSDDQMCIRMASGTWAFTGAYYIKQILDEDIAGFDISRGLDYVQ